MKKNLSLIAFAGLLSFSLGSIARAADFNGVVAQLPVVSESHDKGVFTDLIKAMSRATGKKVEYQVVPFARGLQLVQSGQADFLMPMIKPLDPSKAPFGISKTVIMHVNFNLYYNPKNPITLDQLAGKKIETDLGHMSYFPFKVEGSTDILASLKKVQAGRIDGFVHENNVCEGVIRAEKLEGLEKVLYKRFEVNFVLPKGAEGGPMDQFITEAKQKMRATGEWQKIMAPYDPEEGK